METVKTARNICEIAKFNLHGKKKIIMDFAFSKVGITKKYFNLLKKTKKIFEIMLKIFINICLKWGINLGTFKTKKIKKFTK